MTPHRIVIPPAFAAHAVQVFGDAGRRWLDALPGLVAALAAQWELEVGEPFALSYDYVVAVRRADGTDAVLKLGAPRAELRRAIAVLRLYDGDGMCRLLDADAERHALLLERLRPGAMLAELARRDDDAATRAGAAVMRRLRRPAPAAATRPLAEWFTDAFASHRAEYGGAGPLPADVLARGEAIAHDLLASTRTEVLLHGDLHHYNILSAEREPWLAIDPKGMRGDPGYEVGPFLVNPDITAGYPPGPLRRRLEILAEALEYDRSRLRDWGIAHAVLSACWSAQRGGTGWQVAVRDAESLLAI